MKKLFLILLLHFLCFNFVDAHVAKSIEDISTAPANSTCHIKTRLDLKGKSVTLNDNVTLDFQGGCICNGKLTGTNSKLAGDRNLFDNISIAGTWIVKKISTDMFVDLSKDDAIRNVFALANPSVCNTIEICKGDYWVTEKYGNPSVKVVSNTKVILNGNIRLRPNSKTNHIVVNVVGKNISIIGTGSIIGDRYSHIGSTGEWGMGITIAEAENITISNISIKECWGDCIYITSNSKNVKIAKCKLEGSRRQGISIISADGVLIQDCTIKNIGGTPPGLAIDVEPNAGNSVDNVVVKRVLSSNCNSGFSASAYAKDSYVGSIKIYSSSFSSCKTRYNVLFEKVENAYVSDCQIGNSVESSVFLSQVGSADLRGNTIQKGGKKGIQKYRSLFVKERRNILL